MQRILSEVWLSVLCASMALCLAGCDESTSAIDELSEREAILDGDHDEAVPFTPPFDPTPDDLAAAEDPMLCMCPDTESPVCGIDGETYKNSCSAFCAGVDVDYPGTCECLCTLEWDPVCGVDGETYGNPCAAGCADVAVNYKGTCTGDPCTEDGDCYANQFCQRDNNCTGEGTCEIKADACPDKSTPVCGCDGETYSSPCMAHVYGVSVTGPEQCQIETEPPIEF